VDNVKEFNSGSTDEDIPAVPPTTPNVVKNDVLLVEADEVSSYIPRLEHRS